MGNQKSDIVSNMMRGTQIVKAISDALRDRGADDDYLKRILREGSDLPSKIANLLMEGEQKSPIINYDSYSVSVDYTRTLADMINAGKYDYANKDIVEKNFPIQRPSESEAVTGGGPFRTAPAQNKNIELFLVHLNKVAKTSEVLAHMDKLGLRPARIEPLLALGEKFPNIQRDYLLVALGSVWVRSSGFRDVPGLYRDGSERDLGLGWGDTGGSWRGACRFLAVSK